MYRVMALITAYRVNKGLLRLGQALKAKFEFEGLSFEHSSL